MNDPTRTNYTDGEIAQIEAAAERRAIKKMRKSERTIEPSTSSEEIPMPAGPGNPLAIASHAGLALTTGDLLQRVERLEAIILSGEYPVQRPGRVETEPPAQGPTEEGEAVDAELVEAGEMGSSDGMGASEVACECGHRQSEHLYGSEVSSRPCCVRGCECRAFAVLGGTVDQAEGEGRR